MTSFSSMKLLKKALSFRRCAYFQQSRNKNTGTMRTVWMRCRSRPTVGDALIPLPTKHRPLKHPSAALRVSTVVTNEYPAGAGSTDCHTAAGIVTSVDPSCIRTNTSSSSKVHPASNPYSYYLFVTIVYYENHII